ncbi:MAG: hypothetical protein ACE5GI_07835 [Candidatus Aminicenantales bacterium]
MFKEKKLYPIPLGFQIRFLLRFSVAVLIIFTTASLILYLLINTKLGVSYFNSISLLSHINRNLVKYLLYSLSFQFVFVALATLFITLFATHKIVGPLIRLERICLQMAKGEFPEKFRIRSKDQIQGLAQSMDHCIQELRERIKNIVFYKEKIEEKREKIERLIDHQKMDLAHKELESVEMDLNEIKKSWIHLSLNDFPPKKMCNYFTWNYICRLILDLDHSSCKRQSSHRRRGMRSLSFKVASRD